MLSTALSRDIYQRCFDRQADDHHLLRFTRGAAVCCAALAALAATFLTSVVAALTGFYTLLTAALFLPLVAGLYSRSVEARTAFAAMLVSVAVTATVELVLREGFLWKIPSSVTRISAGGLVMAVMTVWTASRKGVQPHGLP